MLIGIAGKAGAGKDTLGLHIGGTYNYYTASLASPIKGMLSFGLDWNYDKWSDREWKETVDPLFGFSPREAAQKLGTEWRDIIDPSKIVWCKILEKVCGDKLNKTVVCDIRFPHEQDWIHSHGGQIVYINRDVEAVSTHVSETSLDMSKVDFSLDNNRTPAEMFADFDYIIGGLL